MKMNGVKVSRKSGEGSKYDVSMTLTATVAADVTISATVSWMWIFSYKKTIYQNTFSGAKRFTKVKTIECPCK